MDMEAVIRQLQDTMVVLAHVEERNSAGLKDHAEWLAGQQMRLKEQDGFIVAHDRRLAEHDRFIVEHERVLTEHDRFIEQHERMMADFNDSFERMRAESERQEALHAQRMAEFDGKLNGLIAIVDGMIRGKQQ